MRLKTMLGLAAAAAAALTHVASFSQTPSASDYPSKPIKLVVGFSAGGGTDLAARSVAVKLSQTLGVNVVVENKVGANGNLAAEYVARAPADGYTLLYNTSSVILSPWLYQKLSYDPFKDFSPVGLTVKVPFILVANPKVPAKTIDEFVRLLKSSSDKLNYGSAGNGNSTHLASALFLDAAGATAQHVPYKGAGQALVDVLAGQIQFLMDSPNSSVPYIRNGQSKAFAVTSLKRLPLLPEVPTLSESVRDGLEIVAWYGLLAPAKTPAAVVDKLSTGLRQTMESQDLQDRLNAQGIQAAFSAPGEYGAWMQGEYDLWGKVIRNLGIKAD